MLLSHTTLIDWFLKYWHPHSQKISFLFKVKTFCLYSHHRLIKIINCERKMFWYTLNHGYLRNIETITINLIIFNISNRRTKPWCSCEIWGAALVPKMLCRYDFLFSKRVKNWLQYIFRQPIIRLMLFLHEMCNFSIDLQSFSTFQWLAAHQSQTVKMVIIIPIFTCNHFRLWCCDAVIQSTVTFRKVFFLQDSSLSIFAKR